ncbi:hypothetical protein [Paractinoplanes hotanensis]|uniref:Uncharacterized protein n=1 Tax=Paractinoplanes hotanensis TaxID=2906497 RepID=A0ABT0YHM1_9ACTN|nr:hypothetical protein [Actinoplanes hotanensis]MCM4085220.1 hypothetical protein [Actinoplanes hotanensis]
MSKSISGLPGLLLNKENHAAVSGGNLDREIADFLNAVANSVQLSELSSRLGIGEARLMNHFAFRAANASLATSDKCWIRPGIIAAQIAMLVDDDREVIPSYASLYYAAEALSESADDAFTDNSYIVADGVIETPEQFAARPPELKSLEAMGLRVVETDAGPQLQPDASF